MATSIVTGGLKLLVFATPLGWAGLIVGGLAVAGSAAYAASGVNSGIKNNAGGWYDSIMKSLGAR